MVPFFDFLVCELGLPGTLKPSVAALSVSPGGKYCSSGAGSEMFSLLYADVANSVSVRAFFAVFAVFAEVLVATDSFTFLFFGPTPLVKLFSLVTIVLLLYPKVLKRLEKSSILSFAVDITALPGKWFVLAGAGMPLAADSGNVRGGVHAVRR